MLTNLYLIISYLGLSDSPTPATTRSPVYESAPGFLFPGASKACFCKCWGIKRTCECNEYGLLVVKHPLMALARLKAEQHYPRYYLTLEGVYF